MSLKFSKDRSVDYRYTMIPLKYTGIMHPRYPKKELVLIDSFGKHYVAAYRNEVTNRIGITFLVKSTKGGFIFKDKEYKHADTGNYVL